MILKSAKLTRLMFGFAALLAAAGLLLRLSVQQGPASIDWPALTNVLGLLVLTATGAIDPAPGRLRFALSAIALALILPSAYLILTR